MKKITDKNAFNGKKILPHNQRKGAEKSAPKNLKKCFIKNSTNWDL